MSVSTKEEYRNVSLDGLSFSGSAFSAGASQVGWMKALTYGASGSGKTSLISTMPDNLLVLLTEKHGAMTIKRVNPRATILFIEDTILCKCHRVTPSMCKEGASGGTYVKKAKDVLLDAINDLSTKNHPFTSVALDSLTDMQQVLLSGMKGGKPGAKVSLAEWGILIDETKDLVIKLRNLNMHVGVICLSDESHDSEQRMIWRPSLSGKKLPNNLIQYFNLACFQRKIRDSNSTVGAAYESVFDAGVEYLTKTHPALNPIEHPNMRMWVNKLAAYASEHGEGDMPTESTPSAEAIRMQEEQDSTKMRLANPEISSRFAALSYPPAKQLAGLEKYKDDAKLIEVLDARISELREKNK